jgi:tetratricopeptide (TPR) repeat protein
VVSVKSISALAAVLLLSPLSAANAQPAQPNPPVATPAPQNPAPKVQHEANFDAERAQANQLYLAGKHLEALPLYEDLCRQDQANPAFAERHGAGLIEKAGTLTDPKEKNATHMEGIKELMRAQSLGDNSPFVENLLSLFSKTPMGLAATGSMGALPLTVGYYYNGNAQAQPLLQQGEQAFGKKDLPVALGFYQQAAAADPKLYTAALYVGDTYENMKDYANAGTWFAKAIAIDPDRETAYRYWGDALMASGDNAAAKVKFEQAVAADPYIGSSQSGLRQWAILTHTSLNFPHLRPPPLPRKDGKITDESFYTETGDGHSSWLVYAQTRLARNPNVVFDEWVMSGSATADPQFDFVPNGYVHTLAEEVEAINAMLADLKKKLASGAVTQDKLEPTLKTLLAMQKDNMLEPFIMISFNDAGLRHGYPEYRAAHRDQVIAYIDKYMIGPPLPANATTPYVRVQP